MVKYEYLIKSLSLYLKHHDYPKLNAINYYEENKRKFRKEKWDVKDYTDDEKYSSVPGHLFTQQNELQKQVEYDDKLGLKMIRDYQLDAFHALPQYAYGNFEKLRDIVRRSGMMWMAGSVWESDEEREAYREAGVWEEEKEKFSKVLDSLVNDPNPDNWFFDNRIPIDETLLDGPDETRNERWDEMENKWKELYRNIKDPEKLTPKDWKKMYEDMGISSGYTMKDWSNKMSHAIEQSPHIQTDCIAWRYGELPVDLIKQPSWNPESGMWDGPDEYVKPSLHEGLTGTFKGFTGLTYNEKLIQNGSYLKSRAGWTQGSKNRYKIKVIIPHGTQGMVLGDSVECDSFQNELLLNRNQRFVIYEVNENKKTATIILY